MQIRFQPLALRYLLVVVACTFFPRSFAQTSPVPEKTQTSPVPEKTQTSPVPEKVKVRVCGGGRSGTYIKVAQYLKYMLEASKGNQVFDVEVYSTSGSKENIEAINDGRCDLAVLQHDATTWFRSKSTDNPVDVRIVARVYDEQAHLVCHRDLEVKSFADLEALSNKGQGTVYIGSLQSGGAMTLENLKALYPNDYKNIDPTPTEPILDASGNVRFDSTQSSIQAALNNKACAFFVTRVPYKYLVNGLSKKDADQLHIADIDDWKFNNLKDPEGTLIYDFVRFDDIQGAGGSDLYEDLRAWGWGGAKTTIQVSADLVVNSEWEVQMLTDLKESNRSGGAQRWSKTIEKVGIKKGNFDQLAGQLKSVEVKNLPESN